MSTPQKGTAPDQVQPSKTLFYNEGRTTAVLVENKGGQHSAVDMAFSTAELALGWCRASGAMLVYCPIALERN